MEAGGLLADERLVADEHDVEGAGGLSRRFDGALDHNAGGEVAAHGVHPDHRPSGSIAHLGPAPAARYSSTPPARSPLRLRNSRSGRTHGAAASADCSGGKATGRASRASSGCGVSCRGCSSVFSWVPPSFLIPFALVPGRHRKSRSARLNLWPRRRSGTTRGFDPRRTSGKARRKRRGRAASWGGLTAPPPVS